MLFIIEDKGVVSHMEKRKPMLRLMAEAVDAPRELLSGEPLIELAGDQRIMIENHTGVKEYACDCIRVGIKGGSVSIGGCDLRIARMQKKQLVIVGTIRSLCLERGGGR